MKPGDKLIFFKCPDSRPSKLTKIPCKFVKRAKSPYSITVEFEDGRRSTVRSENVEMVR